MSRPSDSAIPNLFHKGTGRDGRVFIVSDSLGETAELVARAALSQFGGSDVEILRFPMISSPDNVEPIVNQATERPTLVVYTLIRPDVQEKMVQLCEKRGVIAVDIMGPMLSGFIQVLGRAPVLRPGLIHQLDEHYFKRVECVEFAVKYDDAKDARGFLQADIVLVGVSRCSKTPVSMYLANRLYRVANLPLVPEFPVPKQIYDVPRERIVGLRVDPDKLVQIRQERVKTMGARERHYAEIDRILEELSHAEEVFAKLGCPVVDATNKAVEETAVRVLEFIHRRDPHGRALAHQQGE